MAWNEPGNNNGNNGRDKDLGGTTIAETVIKATVTTVVVIKDRLI